MEYNREHGEEHELEAMLREFDDTGDPSRLSLWIERTGKGDWFTSDLFRLWQHADSFNKTCLKVGFPRQCEIFELWYEGKLNARSRV